MGGSMCGHLLAGGYSIAVYSRTRERAEELCAAGATWAPSPAAVATGADVVFTMVGFPADVREVMLGAEGVLSAPRPGGVLVDMTTSEPSLAREIDEAARAGASRASTRPSRAVTSARATQRCRSWSAATRHVVERVRPLFELMGKTIVHQGAAGAGQHTKMVNQTLIATGMIGVCEALLYAYQAGLDPERVLESVSGGAAGSWSLTNYAPRMLKGDFAPGFLVEHFVKDMEIALAEARRMNLALPGLALAHELYLALRAQGDGRCGTQALIRALARLSAIDWQA